MYRQIWEERQKKVRQLERAIRTEKEAVVRELVNWFEKKGSTAAEREAGFKKVTAMQNCKPLLKFSSLATIHAEALCSKGTVIIYAYPQFYYLIYLAHCLLFQVEVYYRKRHQQQLKALLQRLAAEETAAVSRMIEKHSNEMLLLIQEKVNLAFFMGL